MESILIKFLITQNKQKQQNICSEKCLCFSDSLFIAFWLSFTNDSNNTGKLFSDCAVVHTNQTTTKIKRGNGGLEDKGRNAGTTTSQV